MGRHVQQVPTVDTETGRIPLMAYVRSLHTYTRLPALLMPARDCLCLTACREQDPMRREWHRMMRTGSMLSLSEPLCSAPFCSEVESSA